MNIYVIMTDKMVIAAFRDKDLAKRWMDARRAAVPHNNYQMNMVTVDEHAKELLN